MAGIVLALPPLILVGLAIGALASPDRLTRLAILIDPSVIAAVLLIEALLVAWRIGALVDAFRRGSGAIGGRTAALTAIALVIVIVPSVYAAYLTEVARDAALAVFAEVAAPWHPSVRPPPDPDNDFGPSIALATPNPSTALGRFSVLLIGNDSGPGRSTLLTDTMIVASLDPIAGSVSMISIPRDMVDVPLPDGRTYRSKINSLVSFANHSPDQFPGAASGESVLAAALGQLLGIPIDGWAEVNLPGFVQVVDAIGGVDVNVRKGFCDAGYREYGFEGFAIKPGRYHFNGDAALAYARVRKALGESDFTRAARQEEIVVAARDRVVSGGFLGNPAGFIQSVGRLLKTSLAPTTIAEHVSAVVGIERDHVFRQVIEFPLVHPGVNDPRGSVQIPDLTAIRALGATAFPPAGTLPEGIATIPPDPGGPTTSTLPAVTCTIPVEPAGTPEPTAAPTPEPVATPTPAPTNHGGGQPTPAPTPTPTPTPEATPTPDPTPTP